MNKITDRDNECLAIRKELVEAYPEIESLGQISARKLWLNCVGKGKPISLITAYKTLLRYVSKDYKDIFNPLVVGDKSGVRYSIKIDNIIEFIFQERHRELKKSLSIK